MEINHDHSYISKSDKEFAARGYGHEYVRNFRFQYVYTEAENQANHALAGRCSPEDWSKYCMEAAQFRSRHMESVMEAIGAKHWCYQYNKGRDLKSFGSDDWDLFFWCNDFHNTLRNSLSGRDYSYFTLNFNMNQSVNKQREVYESVMQTLSQFQSDKNINVTIQYDISLDETKIKAEADRVAQSLVGKRVSHTPSSGIFSLAGWKMEGRIIESNGSLYFMKKRARKQGYLLCASDILKIFWELNG